MLTSRLDSFGLLFLKLLSPPSLLIFSPPLLLPINLFLSLSLFFSFPSCFSPSPNFLSFSLPRFSLFQSTSSQKILIFINKSSMSSSQLSLSFSSLQSLVHSLTLFTLSLSWSLPFEGRRVPKIQIHFKSIQTVSKSGKRGVSKKETKSWIRLRHREREREKRERREKRLSSERFFLFFQIHTFFRNNSSVWVEERKEMKREEECGSQMIPTSFFFFFFLLAWRVSLRLSRINHAS